MASLQDQFLKAGLVDNKRVKKVKQEKRKQHKKQKLQPKGQVEVDVNKEQVKEMLAERTAKDKAMNLDKQLLADKKAIQAQITQLIKAHAIDSGRADVAYQFTDGALIQKIYVNETVQRQLSKGMVAIAQLDDGYVVVPAVVAEKITQRDASIIVLLNDNIKTEIDEDDPYADYQIPDDLMW